MIYEAGVNIGRERQRDQNVKNTVTTRTDTAQKIQQNDRNKMNKK
jgi:hypothetical protein